MNIFKTVRSPLFNAEDNGGGDDNHQESGITFTPEQQAHMDKIIGQRITSVKASYAGYEDMKEVTELVKAFGYEGSAADIKVRLKNEVEAKKKAAEIEELQDEANKTGSSPELLAEIKALQKKMDDLEKDKQQQQKDMEEKQKAEETWKSQVEEFNEKHSDVDVAKLSENKPFMKFVSDSRPGFSLLEIYDNYIGLVGSAEKAAIEKIKSNNERSTSSGKSKGDPSGGTYGLNDYQQKLAKENGMTNKEFSELRNQVKN